MTRPSDDITKQAHALVARIRPILGGQPAPVVGAALADLLAIWLAGHFDSAGPDATGELRDALLKLHLEAVAQLVPVNEARILEHRAALQTLSKARH